MLRLIPIALQFERVRLVRNRVGMLALLAYFAIGSLSLFLGDRYASEWRAAIDGAQTAEQATIEEAREYIATGKGPADRPWVDMSEPMWQDHYAGTRVLRDPSPLVGIAAGAVDPAPVAFRVHRRADPSAGGGYRIENPELVMGAVDLTFVLAILSPLLIGVLGLGIGSREREERIDRIIVVQSGEVRPWLMTRLLVVTGVTAACNAILCGAAGVISGASLHAAGTLIGFGVSYAALWGGLLAAVSAVAQSVRAQSLTYGVVWMTVCIVMPTVAAEVSLGRVQTDFGVSETLDARGLSYEAYELSIEDITTGVYARYPELAELPAASDEALDSGMRRLATSAVLVAAMAKRVEARQAEARDAQRITDRAAWTSPAVALTVALERLVGVGPEAASAFQAHSMDAVDQRVRWILQSAWNKQPLDSSDFEALVSSAPPPFRWEPRSARVSQVAMGFWLVTAWLFAVVGLRREERRIEA